MSETERPERLIADPEVSRMTTTIAFVCVQNWVGPTARPALHPGSEVSRMTTTIAFVCVQNSTRRSPEPALRLVCSGRIGEEVA